MNPEEESSITDITILPDGRVYLFGASGPVLQMLHAIQLGDPNLEQRIQQLRAVDALQAVMLAEAKCAAGQTIKPTGTEEKS